MRRMLPILALCAAAIATPVRAQETSTAVDAESLAAIDDMLVATRIGERYDKFFGLLFAEAPPQGSGPVALADQQLLRRVFERSPWRRIGAEWRVALSERMTPEQARAVVAFYASEPGRALDACFDAARTTSEMIGCENGIDGPHAQAVSDYMRSPAGAAFKSSMTEVVDLLMPVALHRTLTEDSALAAEVETMCRRRSSLPVCDALPSAMDDAPAP